MSEEINIEIRVPQGTPLSSLLFILYLNPIVRVIIDFCINLFADVDSTWIAADSFEEAVRKMNNGLERIYLFLNMMKLKLNIEKTKCMFIGGQSELQININGVILEKISVMKYLGVIFNDNLKFKSNTDYQIKKIVKKVSMLRRLKKRTDSETRLMLYKTIIMPHYDYCSTILFLTSAQEIDQLQKLKNRAMRIVLNAEPREHIQTMLDKCDLLSVKQRIYFNVLMFMFKIKRNLLPQYLTTLFKRNCDVQPYTLRNNEQFRLPNFRTAQAQTSLTYKGAQVFNTMERVIDTNCSEDRFKQKLREYVKQHY